MRMFQRFRHWLVGEERVALPAVVPPSNRHGRSSVVEIRAAVATNPGRVRSDNQDAAIFSRPADDRALATHGVIALVADGMGGCQGGEIASALACECIPKTYFAS